MTIRLYTKFFIFGCSGLQMSQGASSAGPGCLTAVELNHCTGDQTISMRSSYASVEILSIR